LAASRTDPNVGFLVDRTIRWRSPEGPLRVESCRLPATGRTAGVGAQTRRSGRLGRAAESESCRSDPKSGKLQARVGNPAGPVVVGELIGEGLVQEQSVVGETLKLVAWLQALAEPCAVAIADLCPQVGVIDA